MGGVLPWQPQCDWSAGVNGVASLSASLRPPGCNKWSEIGVSDT